MKRLIMLLVCVMICVPAAAGPTFDDMSAEDVKETAVSAPDPALRSALLDEIDDTNLLLDKLKKVTSLSLDSLGIRNLTGLECLTGLESLSLGGNKIKDIAPLAGLKTLRSLDLSGNGILDIAPLSGLENLVYLDLSDNVIMNAAPLAGLTGLKKLNLTNNDITDVSVLQALSDGGCRVTADVEIISPSPTPSPIFENPTKDSFVKDVVVIDIDSFVMIFNNCMRYFEYDVALSMPEIAKEGGVVTYSFDQYTTLKLKVHGDLNISRARLSYPTERNEDEARLIREYTLSVAAACDVAIPFDEMTFLYFIGAFDDTAVKSGDSFTVINDKKLEWNRDGETMSFTISIA